MDIKGDKTRSDRVKMWIRKGGKANAGGEEWSAREGGAFELIVKR